MKRVLLLLFFAVVCIGASAQSQHLKFQGIPITGTFAQFETKLKAKGWKYDYATSKGENVDTRVYKGTFAGNHGNLWVSRAPKSKQVCGLSFFQDEVYTRDLAESQMERHIEALRRTYPYAEEWVNDRGKTQFDLDEGFITCGILEYDYGAYSVQIAYVDGINQQKYFEERDSDY